MLLLHSAMRGGWGGTALFGPFFTKWWSIDANFKLYLGLIYSVSDLTLSSRFPRLCSRLFFSYDYISHKYFSDKNTRTSQPVTVSFCERGLLKILCKETVLITWSYWNTPQQTIRSVIRYWLYWGDQQLSYLLAKKRRDNFALLFFVTSLPALMSLKKRLHHVQCSYSF